MLDVSELGLLEDPFPSLSRPVARRRVSKATLRRRRLANYLAQTVLIHDLSLHTAQTRIAELEKRLAEANTAPSPPTSSLGGLLDTDRLTTPTAQPGNPAPLVPAETLIRQATAEQRDAAY